MRADNQKYSQLIVDLENNHARGKEKNLANVNRFHYLFLSYKSNKISIHQMHKNNYDSASLSFSQTTVISGTDRNTWPKTKCYKCDAQVHISTLCPVANEHETKLLQYHTNNNYSDDDSCNDEYYKNTGGGDKERF